MTNPAVPDTVGQPIGVGDWVMWFRESDEDGESDFVRGVVTGTREYLGQDGNDYYVMLNTEVGAYGEIPNWQVCRVSDILVDSEARGVFMNMWNNR